MKVIFLGLPASEEQDLLNDGLSIQDIKEISYHEGEVCEATLSIGTMSSEPEEDFYNLTFSDGFKMYDVSGYHLEIVK